MDNVERPAESVVEASFSPLTAPVIPSEAPQQSLSKNAIKKAAKAERHAAYKLVRRAKEKEAKKEKKKVLAAKRAAGDLGPDDESQRQKKRLRIHFGGKVVIDLGFDNMMIEKEIVSLCSQLAYTYSANRNAGFPFLLTYTSLNGRTLQRLESMNEAGYKRWAHTEWWHEGYERLWQGHNAPLLVEEDRLLHEPRSRETEQTPSNRTSNENSSSDKDIQRNVVYLTADSEEELMELRPEETYVIGGICDHNRYKNLCFDKAKASGIRSARLPIGRYLASLPTRKVLTVNQVFEILLKWVETKDWEEAFHAVIPKRKFQPGGKAVSDVTASGSKTKGSDNDGVQEEDNLEANFFSTLHKEQEQEDDKGHPHVL